MPAFVNDILAQFDKPHERALVLLGLALILAFVVRVVVLGALKRLVSRSRSDLDDRVLAHLGGPLVLTILLGGVNAAAAELAISAPWPGVIASVSKTCLVFAWGLALLRTGQLVFRILSTSPRERTWITAKTLPLLEFLLKLIIFGGMVYMIMLAWHINVTTWIASAGVAGIAVGFAAKDTLANLIAGVFILADQPYKVGDYVVLVSGVRGEVTEIGMRTTRLMTRDDVEVNLPNAVIAAGQIVNETRGTSDKMRVRVPVGVAYGSDVDEVESVLLSAARDIAHLAEEPAPRVRMREFGESSLNFELLAWVEQPVYRGLVLHQLFRKVYKALGTAGIEIPFPKRDVYVKEMPASGRAAASEADQS